MRRNPWHQGGKIPFAPNIIINIKIRSATSVADRVCCEHLAKSSRRRRLRLVRTHIANLNESRAKRAANLVERCNPLRALSEVKPKAQAEVSANAHREP